MQNLLSPDKIMKIRDTASFFLSFSHSIKKNNSYKVWTEKILDFLCVFVSESCC